MFHVKHCGFSQHIDSLKQKLASGKIDLTGFPIELFIYSCKQLPESFVFISSEDFLINIHSETVSADNDLGFFIVKSSIDQASPAGFKSGFSESVDKIYSQASAGLLPKVLFSSKEAFYSKCFEVAPQNIFTFDNNTSYDKLVSWLKDSSFSFVDVVTLKGECSLKGGMIDVFPFNRNTPLRISFLSEEVEFFLFDVESQITTTETSINRLLPKGEKGNQSLSGLVSTNTQIVILEKNIPTKNNKISNGSSRFQTIKYENFIKKDFKIKTVTSKYLTSIGYLFKDLIIVPIWFVNKGVLNTGAEKTRSLIDFNSLSKGDSVVHKHHGVAEYKGVFDFGDDNNTDERLLLHYSDGGKIYVSIQNLGLLEFFASKNESLIKLDSLSKKNLWDKKKKSAKKHVNEIIDELLYGYAERSAAHRVPLTVDDDIEKQFINSFPFEETKDQNTSWDEISSDLLSNKPMDRLLCGDVGFGKTEIALRATFRTAYAGKQVAILAPTTILSSQHFQTFNKRLSPYSIDVGLISAFKSKSINDKTLLRLKNGEVNVIIGTHSLLSDRVVFKDLGLLIIDEEHRFGVKQKEKILTLKKEIDVLSMSATPIPRTLHMSLSGIKSISTINTSPKARFPIQTHIKYYNIQLIKSAIMFEINRGGQVFFVHNNVKTLDSIVQILETSLPGLNIKPAHGQEPKKQLEKTMYHFIEGEIDVLVCTSIIETGIDIPNVNTIIINKAHNLGLSQLYQIRGRVGRSDKQAFAYLLIPKGLRLSRNAYKRLKSIEKNTSLGSGYNISKSDMEIRGVGSIFGYKQSGGLSQIGYGLYSKMIKEVLQEKKIIKKKFVIEPEEVSVMLYFDVAIPDEYICSESIRLEFYRKFACCNELEGFSKIEYEVENRYGPIPRPLTNLINNYKTRVYCAKLGIKKCVFIKNTLQLEFLPSGVASKGDLFIPKLIQITEEQKAKPRFLPVDNNILHININLKQGVDIYSFVDNILNKLLAIFLT
ncbi:MAG: DEAD/DEAH box helicase [Candidatus Marinimicrobia bacterium]|nr:DEAD/DEAH box helicase [Candidatus Neomarinimicrobiota bacterium]